jgi:DNA-binding response OmpR family regulator
MARHLFESRSTPVKDKERETPVVLVADDEPAMLTLVARHMKSLGFEVLEASDGSQAWNMALDALPDVVVLDVMMPGMSGWEVCKRIRETAALAHTGVVMLTGIGENLNEMTSPLYGADAYVLRSLPEDLIYEENIPSLLRERFGVELEANKQLYVLPASRKQALDYFTAYSLRLMDLARNGRPAGSRATGKEVNPG